MFGYTIGDNGALVAASRPTYFNYGDFVQSLEGQRRRLRESPPRDQRNSGYILGA